MQGMRRDLVTRETTTHPCCASAAASAGASEDAVGLVARNGITERDIEFHYSLCQTVCGHCVVPLNHVGSTLLPIITHSHVRHAIPSSSTESMVLQQQEPHGHCSSDIGYKIWKIWNVFIRILSLRGWRRRQSTGGISIIQGRRMGGGLSSSHSSLNSHWSYTPKRHLNHTSHVLIER